MGKLIYEVPAELKDFARLFDSLSYRNSDYGSVFHDFVSFWTGGMLLDGDKELAEQLQKRYGKDYDYFSQLIVEMMKAYNNKMDRLGWYDGLGIFYETIASRYKSSYLGQFFTPPDIVHMMTQLVNPTSRDSVADCCCGSGRMLLAVKAVNPGAKSYAADVDPVCAKMTAINMGMHGCIGEVSCMNSLTMEWRFGYVINPFFSYGGGIPPIPHLSPIPDFESSVFFWKKEEFQEAAVQHLETGQLSLF